MSAERDSRDLPAGGYSIRVASRLSGLSADTLRMWERRYGCPKPERNESQVRVYSEQEIERLVLIARALKAGFRAGEVARRSAKDLCQLLAGSAVTKLTAEARSPTLEAILRRIQGDDLPGLRGELRQAVATLGPKRFLIEIAAPLVDQVGEAWAAGRIEVRQEHLFSEVLATHLRLLLSAHEDAGFVPSVLLTTLSNELHGLGLDMAALYLALEGALPRLLGLNTPPRQIVEAAIALGVQVVGLSVSRAADAAETRAHVKSMLRELPSQVELWLGGAASAQLELEHPRVRIVKSWQDLDAALAAVRER